MNILITGVHGFVGTNLVKSLSKRHKIYGLDIINPSREGVIHTFSWEELDEVQGATFKVQGAPVDIDAVIHLAGKAHDTKNQTEADVYFKVNTGLTQRIFDWYLKQPQCKRFIFFSTVKSAADRVEGDVLTEDCVPTPVGPYGESKIKAENYIIGQFAPSALSRPFHDFTDADAVTDVEVQGEKFKVQGLKRVYILRPCMIHGPGNKGNLNLLYGVVRKGIPWPLGAFENRRSFTSIGNLQAVIAGLLEKDAESGIYHIGDDEAQSTNELIEVICRALGKKAHVWRIPRGLMNGLAKVGGWLHLPLNPERMQKLTENYVVSNEKIKTALGMKQMPVRAKDGLTETIKSFAE